MTTTRVALCHPTTGEVWHCPATAVDIWRAKGWTPATAAPRSRRTSTKEDGDV